MPTGILETSAADRTLTLLDVANDVTVQCGLGAISTMQGGTQSAHDRLALLIRSLVNEQEQILLDKAGAESLLTTWSAILAVDQANYTPTAGYLKLAGEPRISEHPLTRMDYDDVLESVHDLFDMGTPESYYSRDQQIYIEPKPGPEFMRDKIVYADSTWYVCTKDHDSGDDHLAPASNTDDWTTSADFHTQMNAWIASDSEWDTDNFAWTSGRRYVRGYMDTPIVSGRVYLTENTDVINLPVEYYPALTAAVVWRLMGLKGIGDADMRRDQKETALTLRRDRIMSRRKDGTNPREFIPDEERI